MLKTRRLPIGWSTALAVALVSSALSHVVPAAAATTTTTILALPANAQAGPGTIVQVPITAGPADGIYGIDMTVQYDAAVLQAQSVSVSGIASTAGFAIASNLANAGSIIMSTYATTNPLSGSGEIARIRFQVIGSPGNVSYLRFVSSPSINEGGIHADTTSGTLTVTCAGAANGTGCGNACFVGATCQSGACSGGTTIVVPSEISGVTAGSQDSDISWTASSAGAGTVYDVVRGSTSQLPVGGGIESCFASGVASAAVSDGSAPPAGNSYWYLVRGRNTCGTGTYGYAATNGVPTAERVTSACP